MKRLMAIFFVGWSLATGIECPLCKSVHETFLSSWLVVARNHVNCPTCWSRERHRHLWLFLKKEMPEFFTKELSVLHWAPHVSLANRFKEVATLDYHRVGWTSHIHLNGELYENDPTIPVVPTHATGYPDERFDVVIGCHFLVDVLDDHAALAEMYRVLKPGGCALLMEPVHKNLKKTDEDETVVSPTERLVRFGQEGHVRRYAPDCIERFAQAGFTVTYYPLKGLSLADRRHYGLDGYDDDYPIDAARGADIYLCKKVTG